MKNSNLFVVAIAWTITWLCLPSLALSQGNPTGGTSINTVETTQMVSDQTALAALEEAAKASGKAVVTGKYYTIPVEALKGAGKYLVYLEFSKWLACVQVCKQFQIWAFSHKRTPPFFDEAAFDVKINVVDASGTLIMVVTVPYSAKCDSTKGSVAYGYVAPNGPQGATMKLDVFGDGSLILERHNCPCHK